MQYRKDIQILRGVAVTLVVLFHLDLSAFKAGFLGVDVFFVISGYLMAMMYDPERIGHFYLSRAKRILPAYVTVVILTLIAAAAITAPGEFDQTATQAVLATGFVSNIGFWSDNSYFDKAAFKPLLHLWSLGVEIQFYLLVPLFAWLFRKSVAVYWLCLIGSAAACFVLLGISPKTAFYLLPFRLWEFLIGFGVASLTVTATRGASAWLGAAALVLLLGAPLLPVDGMAQGFVSGHPGLMALLVSLATAGVLRFGLPSRLLSSVPATVLERIGTGSYSIYLAHFPVIVLFLYQPFSGTVLAAGGLGRSVVEAALIVAASALLFTAVERPFRADPRALRWVALGLVAVPLLAAGGRIAQDRLIPAAEMKIYRATLDRDAYRCGKINRLLDPRAISCDLTPALASPARRILLVGNSHADAIKTAFAAAAEADGAAVRFMVENTPLMPGGASVETVVREAVERRADAIVLHYSPGAVEDRVVRDVVARARRAGIDVAFILPVPVWSGQVPAMLLRHLREGEPLPVQTLDTYQRDTAPLIDALAAIGDERFRVYPVAPRFCAETCAISAEDGTPLYHDSTHLTLTGAERLRPVFARLVRDLSPGPEAKSGEPGR